MQSHFFNMFETILAKDIEAFESYMHSEFISVSEFEMSTREDFLTEMQEWFDDETFDLRNANLVILADNPDMHSFQYERNIDGKRLRITNVALIKDKKLWRHIINYIPLD